MNLLNKIRMNMGMPARKLLGMVAGFFKKHFGHVERNIKRTCRSATRYTRPRYITC